jgi:hypothetical protein
VDLVEVDVVGAEAAQAGVDLRHDRRPRQATVLRASPHRDEHLGSDDHVVALDQLAEHLARDLLARAVGVGVGGVERRDPGVERGLVERPGLVDGQ